jgi:hypothetical protein
MNQPTQLDVAQIPDERLRAAVATAFADPALVAGFETLVEGKIEHATKSWSAGGCLLLAEALRRLVGGELIGFSDFDAAGERRVLEHVALELSTPDGTQLVDERGYWDDDLALIDYLYSVCEWEEPKLAYPGQNALASWSVETATAEGLLFDEALCAQLTTVLARELTTPAR